MGNSLSKKEFVEKLSAKMNINEKDAELWVNSVIDTFYESFKAGYGVSINGFGNFYLDKRRNSTAFKFNPSQKLKKLFGWSSSYKGDL